MKIIKNYLCLIQAALEEKAAKDRLLFTVWQFTGKKDIHDVDIYEGDIVKSGNGREWEIKHGEYSIPDVKQTIPCFGWYMEGDGVTLPIAGTLEVIGNIYETKGEEK